LRISCRLIPFSRLIFVRTSLADVSSARSVFQRSTARTCVTEPSGPCTGARVQQTGLLSSLKRNSISRGRRISRCRLAGTGGVFLYPYPVRDVGRSCCPGCRLSAGKTLHRPLPVPGILLCNAFYALSFMVDPVNICCPVISPWFSLHGFPRTVSPVRFPGTGRVGHEER